MEKLWRTPKSEILGKPVGVCSCVYVIYYAIVY